MMSGRRADPVEDFALVRRHAQRALGPDVDADVLTHLDELLRPRFEPQSRRARMLPLSAFCAHAGVSHIDFLKIDVEGDELSVLEGLGDLAVGHAVVEVDSRRSSPAAVRTALEVRRLEVTEFAAPECEGSGLTYLIARGR